MVQLHRRSVTELKKIASRRGLRCASSLNKKELVAYLRKQIKILPDENCDHVSLGRGGRSATL